MTWPRRAAIILGRSARVTRKRPSTFVSSIATASSSFICATGSRPRARPALLSRISGVPAAAQKAPMHSFDRTSRPCAVTLAAPPNHASHPHREPERPDL
jgi:hypothetical protein